MVNIHFEKKNAWQNEMLLSTSEFTLHFEEAFQQVSFNASTFYFYISIRARLQKMIMKIISILSSIDEFFY